MENTRTSQREEKHPSKPAETIDKNVGGQAVIEGVMMRSKKAIATAVRLPDGTIELKKQPFISFIDRHRYLNLPILRGAINFFEMLFIGLDTLNWSADVQIRYEDASAGKDDSRWNRIKNTILLAGTLVFALALVLLVFFTLPIYIATLLGLAKGALLFNLVAGTIRLLLFLFYLFLVAKMPDIKRVFRYHGAEHMSIFAFESAETLDIETVRTKSRFHPRCGTSFILIVALFSILFFGLADSAFPLIFGHLQSFPQRLATHIMVLPVIAGISYELLKLSGKFHSNGFVRILIQPGLWLQKLTTGQPDDDMLEVALCALKAALETEEGQR